MKDKVASCPNRKVGGPCGPSNTESNWSETKSCIVPNKAVEQTGAGQTHDVSSELLDNAQALGSTGFVT
jgi:hypothetical protein